MTSDEQLQQLSSWWDTALSLHTQEKYAEAVTNYQNILKLMPTHVDSLHYCAVALYQLDRYRDAETYFNDALTFTPNNPDILANYGLLLVATQREQQAVICYLKALQQQPNNAIFYLNIGNAYRNLGELSAAEASYQQAIALDNTLVSAYFSLAEFARNRKDFDVAEHYFSLAIDHDPDTINCYTKLTSIKNFSHSDLKLINQIKYFLDKKEITEKQRCIIHFSLGKAYNDIKDYTNAFSHYQAGNEIRKIVDPNDIEKDLRYMKGISKAFNRDMLTLLATYGSQSHRPIFIVGMPRSGTTLTEQILSSHPDIFGAGELSYIPTLAFPVAQTINSKNHSGSPILLPEIISQYSESYLDQISQIDSMHQHIVDKMPHNFLHIGLIHILFPNSTIIHIKRDPIDTCLSCYFQNFVPGHGYSDDLEKLGRYYLAYQQLMTHWEQVLPGRILTIEYEALIGNFEVTTHNMLQHIGVKWNDSCLQHHKNQRVPKTASHWQACQPTYKTSMQRWRNYEPYIQPLIKLLGPASSA